MAMHDFTSNSRGTKKLGEPKSEPTTGKTAIGIPADAEDMEALKQGVPPESVALNGYYKKSGLTAADLAAATGLSVGAIRIALSGVRYRDGEPKTVVPPDPTVAKLASALGLEPQVLRSLGRERAAEMLAEGKSTAIDDLDTKAAIAGRQNLARQVLAVFSTEELRTEIARREQGDE